MKRMLSLLLCALLLFPLSVCADWSALDSVLSPFLDTGTETSFRFTADFTQLYPYGEATVQMIDRLLPHLLAEATLTESTTKLSFLVDSEPVFDLAEEKTDSGTILTTSLLPNRSLSSSGSATDALFGPEETSAGSFDPFEAFREAQTLLPELKEVLPSCGDWKKANFKIKNVGTAKWECIARLTAEESAELQPLLVRFLGCGMDSTYRSQLEKLSFRKALTVVLYQTAQDGEDMAVYLKGNVDWPDGTIRQISYLWAFSGPVSSYRFELTKGKDGNRSIHALYSITSSGTLLSVDGTWDAEFKENGQTRSVSEEHHLTGLSGKGSNSLSGSTIRVASSQGEKTTSVYQPDLTIISADGKAALSGTVSFSQKLGKHTRYEGKLIFDEAPAQSLAAAAESGTVYEVGESENAITITFLEDEPTDPANIADDGYLVGAPPPGYADFTVPKAPVTVLLDTADQSVLSALRQELFQNSAGRFLIALAKLPKDDLVLLSDNLSEEQFALFLSTVEELRK